MPTYFTYYFARYIDLKEGTFHEEEVTEGFLNRNESSGDIQVLEKRYSRTVDLGSRRRMYG